MKKIRLLTLLWVVLVASTLAGCGDNKNTTNADSNNSGDLIIEDTTWQYDAVIDYNDSLVEIAEQCIIAQDAILTNYNESENIDTAIDNTISQCQDSINQINELWDWEWDSSLKDWIIKILELDITYFTKFKELLPYLTTDELPEAEAQQYSGLVEEINALDLEMQAANNDLIEIQSQFAENHWYQLEEPAVEVSEEA